MSLSRIALQKCNQLLVATTGLRLVPEWRLHWRYTGAEDPDDDATAREPLEPRRSAARINVGCGADIREGWLNVDARPVQPDSESFLCCELLKIHRYVEDGCADEVLAQDILEHFSWRDLPTLITRLTALLKPGGRLVVQSPDLDAILDAYRSGALSHEEAQRLLYGDQTYPQNTHRNIWSDAEARRRIVGAGLTVERVERTGYNVLCSGLKGRLP